MFMRREELLESGGSSAPFGAETLQSTVCTEVMKALDLGFWFLAMPKRMLTKIEEVCGLNAEC